MDQQAHAKRVEEAVDAFGDAVYRLALAQMRSAADADDVSQDVFLRLLREDRVFKNTEHMKAWLLRVTINRCRDLHRSAWRSVVSSTTDYEGGSDGTRESPIERLSDPSEPVEDATIRRLTRHPVWKLFGALTPEQRAIIHLRYIEGYSDSEIAGILQVNPITVRTRLHKAKVKLKKLLQAPTQPIYAKEGISHGNVTI